MPAASRPITILVADDDAQDRELLEEAWAKAKPAGKLRFVTDGLELLDYLEHRGAFEDPELSPRPSLILLDLNMPRKSGHEVLAKIKSDRSKRGIPVVVLTTSAAREDIDRAYDGGANSYIRRPASLDDFEKMVEALAAYWTVFVDLPTEPPANDAGSATDSKAPIMVAGRQVSRKTTKLACPVATKDADLEDIGVLTCLATLDLDGTTVTDQTMKYLSGLTQLQRLYLRKTAVTDEGLRSIAGLTELRRLLLKGTKVTDAGIEHLAKFAELQMLDLAGTEVSDTAVERIAKLSQLRNLSLQDTKITDACAEFLAQLAELRQLNVQRTEVSDATVQKLKEKLPNCRVH